MRQVKKLEQTKTTLLCREEQIVFDWTALKIRMDEAYFVLRGLNLTENAPESADWVLARIAQFDTAMRRYEGEYRSLTGQELNTSDPGRS